jgi:hypothetical protein
MSGPRTATLEAPAYQTAAESGNGHDADRRLLTKAVLIGLGVAALPFLWVLWDGGFHLLRTAWPTSAVIRNEWVSPAEAEDRWTSRAATLESRPRGVNQALGQRNQPQCSKALIQRVDRIDYRFLRRRNRWTRLSS